MTDKWRQMTNKCQTNDKCEAQICHLFVISLPLVKMTNKWQTNDKQMSDKCQTNVRFEAQNCHLIVIRLSFVCHLSVIGINGIQKTNKSQTHDGQTTNDRQLKYKWQTEKEHWEGAYSWEEHPCMISLHQEYLLRRSIHITGKDHIPESVHIYIYIYIYIDIHKYSAKGPVRTYPREDHYCMISLHQEHLLRRSKHIVHWEAACSWEGAYYYWERPYCTQDNTLYICCFWKEHDIL